MKRTLSVILAVCMLLALTPFSAFAKSELRNPRVSDGVTTWDCVWFGNYRQSMKPGGIYDVLSAYNNEPVKWRVLNIRDNKALLLSDKILDSAKFHNRELVSVTYADSFLYGFCNDNIVKNLFTDDEKQAVITYEKDSRLTEPGIIAPASESIMRNAAYGFTNDKTSSDTRKALSTDYVKSYIGYTDLFYWLSDTYNYKASVATGSGEIKTAYYNNDNNFGIRPVTVVDLSKNVWRSAGTVASNGTVNEIPYGAKADNPVTVKAKAVTLKYKTLKKQDLTVKRAEAISVKNAKGKLTFKKAKGNKKITVAKNGRITVKKGIKKGTYKVRIKVTAAGNAEYNPATKTVRVTFRIV